MPMAVLVTTLMTFGKLSANNEITAFKASGITYNSLLKRNNISNLNNVKKV